MNEFERVSAAELERLADGELSVAERRSVLLALDQDPDGWRRLALTFLEVQAMRESLRRIPVFPIESPASASPLPTPAVPAPKTPSSPASLRPHRNGSRNPSWSIGLVCAGISLFCLGWMARPDRIVAPRDPTTAWAPETRDGPVLASREPALPATNSGGIEHQTLRLEIPDTDGRTQAVEVPVIEGRQVRVEDLMAGPSVLPERVYDQLERTGRQIYEQRHLYVITLEDGRRGVVPVRDLVVEQVPAGQFQ